MPNFHFLPGAIALSNFRKIQLLDALKASQISLKSIEAQFHYFIWSDSIIDALKIQQLKVLLKCPVKELFTIHKKHKSYYVTPRLGTVSPWASKATDIAKICQLNLLRIERGIKITYESQKDLSQDQLMTLYQLTHDRMTESILHEMSHIEQLYQILPDKSFLRIELLEKGKSALQQANQELGLALSDDEIDYLDENFRTLKETPQMLN